MKFTQKKGHCKTEFVFGDDELDYAFRESGVHQGASIPYYRIGPQWLYKKKSARMYYIYAAYASVLIGMLFAHYGLPHGMMNSLKILLVFSGLGFALLLIKYFDKDVMITMMAGEPPLRLLDDRQYDTILQEILRRSEAQARLKCKDIDFSADPVSESKKFFWARYQGLVSEAEFNDAMARLAALKQGEAHKQTTPAGTLMS